MLEPTGNKATYVTEPVNNILTTVQYRKNSKINRKNWQLEARYVQ